MNIQELKKEITSVNAKIKAVNAESMTRNGTRKTYLEQLSKAVEKYEALYGIKISEANIDTEMNRVVDGHTTRLREVETILSLIDQQKYAEANALITGEAPVQGLDMSVVAELTVAEFVPAKQLEVDIPKEVLPREVVEPNSVNLTPEPAVSVPVSIEVPVNAVPAQIVNTVPDIPAPPEMPQSVPVVEEIKPSFDDMVSPPPAPIPGLSNSMAGFKPVANTLGGKPTSFNSILSGTAFTPTGGR